MKGRFFIPFFFLIAFCMANTFVYAQSDTLNATDAQGWKQGKWIENSDGEDSEGCTAGTKLEEGYYKDYWTDHINKCLQGVWGHDYNEETKEGGYRWIPGNLFFYVNDTIIKMEESESREVICKPKLRDVEWYIFYALTVCDGFSGFELDDTYTSYKPLGKLLGTLKNSD